MEAEEGGWGQEKESDSEMNATSLKTFRWSAGGMAHGDQNTAVRDRPIGGTAPITDRPNTDLSLQAVHKE